ncbi:MAG: hypothetical protein U0263_28620 [Polyangiaceae bacterium]
MPRVQARRHRPFPQAFEKLAELELGRVPISWTYYVPCSVSGIRYRFKGSNQWWTAVQIETTAAILRLEYDSGRRSVRGGSARELQLFRPDLRHGSNPTRFGSRT